MRVVVKIEINDEVRRALNARCGLPGLATRYFVRSLVDLMLEHDISDALAEYRASRTRSPRRPKR